MIDHFTKEEVQTFVREAGYTAAVHTVRACAAWVEKNGNGEGLADRLLEAMLPSIEQAYRSLQTEGKDGQLGEGESGGNMG